MKVSKDAKIRNRYNQVPHLTQDTNGKVTNSQLDTTNESQEVSPFPAGDRKAMHHLLEHINLDITITHSMARHRKSPRSRRYLMVFDPLTPSQGHQFDPRVKIFSVSWSTAHPL